MFEAVNQTETQGTDLMKFLLL